MTSVYGLSVTATPLTATSLSPVFRPACSAGPPSTTCFTKMVSIGWSWTPAGAYRTLNSCENGTIELGYGDAVFTYARGLIIIIIIRTKRRERLFPNWNGDRVAAGRPAASFSQLILRPSRCVSRPAGV